MKISCQIITDKGGTRTVTKVDGEPANEAEKVIYKCLHAGVNRGLDVAAEYLNQHGQRAVRPGQVKDVLAKIVDIESEQQPEGEKK